MCALQQRLVQLESQNESVCSELKVTKDKMASQSLTHKKAVTSLDNQLIKVIKITREVATVGRCLINIFLPAQEKEISASVQQQKTVVETDLLDTQQKVNNCVLVLCVCCTVY